RTGRSPALTDDANAITEMRQTAVEDAVKSPHRRVFCFLPGTQARSLESRQPELAASSLDLKNSESIMVIAETNRGG
ncbi:MAG: hypothetical protein AAGA03_15830, partial [Planctomycetota bacterium]